jgi:hypothetical protein
VNLEADADGTGGPEGDDVGPTADPLVALGIPSVTAEAGRGEVGYLNTQWRYKKKLAIAFTAVAMIFASR